MLLCKAIENCYLFKGIKNNDFISGKVLLNSRDTFAKNKPSTLLIDFNGTDYQIYISLLYPEKGFNRIRTIIFFNGIRPLKYIDSEEEIEKIKKLSLTEILEMIKNTDNSKIIKVRS